LRVDLSVVAGFRGTHGGLRLLRQSGACSHAACSGVWRHNRGMKREQSDQVDGSSAGAGPSQGHSGPRHSEPESRGSSSKLHRTRTSIMWVTTLVGLVVLAFLLVFILQNLDS